MIRSLPTSTYTWVQAHTKHMQVWSLQFVAFGILVILLVVNILMWPISSLGYEEDAATGSITFVEVNSPAAQAGLQVGDKIVTLYGLSWNDVVHHWNLLSLAEPWSTTVHMRVERMYTQIPLVFVVRPPDSAFQLMKASMFVLALLCWITGYVLGIIRRHEVAGGTTAALFWLTMSSLFSLYTFAAFASLPLYACLEWAILTLFIPFGIYTHIQFPARPRSARTQHLARMALLITCLGTSAIIGGAVLVWQPTLIVLIDTLYNLLSVAVCVCFIGSGIVLYSTYRSMRIAHIRRQIRLIGTACFVVASAWLVLVVVPEFLGDHPFINDTQAALLTGLIPLAYLASGTIPNLYRVDRVAMRIGAAVTALTALAFMGMIVLPLTHPHTVTDTFWLVLAAVALYRPMYRLARQIFPLHHHFDRTYEAMERATTQFTTTLDLHALVTMLHDGVCESFHHPTFAFYMAVIEDSTTLQQMRQENLPALPITIPPGALTTALMQHHTILEARVLHRLLATTSLTLDEQTAMQCPNVALWCPLYQHSQLLGVLTIGPDPNLDPYHATDFHELQRLLAAASLAFTNSVAYQQQCAAEATIRQLYVKLQQAQDETASAIARELHDEVINVNVLLNIQSIQKLRVFAGTSPWQKELDILLESERTVAQSLRMICEQLHPTGIDDPLGLASSLRIQIERMQTTWDGVCHLNVVGTPIPIPAFQQREAVRITREALANAVKHAQATTITTTLRYPAQPDGFVEVVVADDGRSAQAVILKPGHWGIRNMYESARTAGGTIIVQHPLDGGTVLIFQFLVRDGDV